MSLVRHEVDPCPRCGARHRFAIEVAGSEGELMFGGPGEGREGTEVGLTCPDTGELFTDRLELPPGTTFQRVVRGSDVEAARADDPPPTPGASEYEDWVTGSRAFATDFCRTMLTTSSAAIPVYFAVLKYLGTDRLDGSLGGKVSVVPPVLFLATMVLFALALRPRLAPVTLEAFRAFRAERLVRLNRFIVAGSCVFGAGMAVALVVFVRATGTV